MNKIDVGKEFYFRLVNRNKHQGDGKFNAEDFRKKYLQTLDNKGYWNNRSKSEFVTFDFKNVKKIGPSFANEAFGYFMKYTSPKNLLSKIIFENTSKIQKMIIDKELETAASTE